MRCAWCSEPLECPWCGRKRFLKEINRRWRQFFRKTHLTLGTHKLALDHTALTRLLKDLEETSKLTYTALKKDIRGKTIHSRATSTPFAINDLELFMRGLHLTYSLALLRFDAVLCDTSRRISTAKTRGTLSTICTHTVTGLEDVHNFLFNELDQLINIFEYDSTRVETRLAGL